MLEQLSTHAPALAAASSITWLLYVALLYIYRLTLHPLAQFPGPKLAAMSYWYEFYYDIIRSPSGQYMYRLEELHKAYGPIIRINPDEVQIKDIEFFDRIYTTGMKKGEQRNRYPRANAANGSPTSIASTEDHVLHRLRRSAINKYFSKAAVARLEPRLQTQIKLLTSKLEGYAGTGSVVELGTVFTALTLDVITEYSFGKSWGCLMEPNFSPAWKTVMTDAFLSSQLRKQLPTFNAIFGMLPQWLARRLNPDLAVFFSSQKEIDRQVEATVQEKRQMGSRSTQHQEGEGPTIFHEILDSDLPDKEKSTYRLADEGLVVVFAGAETSARTLTCVAYHVLSNPSILEALQIELDNAIPNINNVSLRKLESLSYLTAVIREGLRYSAPFTNRSLVYSPKEGIQYEDWTIPPRTPICMNLHTTLHDPHIYDLPETFNPDRWTTHGPRDRIRDLAFLPFSRGARSCLGMNLAWAELYLTIAHLFRLYEMELFDTNASRDVDVMRDCFVGLPSSESKGVRVRIVEKRK